jgi:hypothetical protein
MAHDAQGVGPLCQIIKVPWVEGTAHLAFTVIMLFYFENVPVTPSCLTRLWIFNHFWMLFI